MKYDSEEAFFKAVHIFAGTSAADIAQMVVDVRCGWTEEQVKNRVRTEVVKLIRGAFNAHLRAEASPTPGDSLLGFRLDRASEELPEEWKIVVTVTKGDISVDLYNPSDEPQALPDTDDLSRAVLAATRLAADQATPGTPA